MHEACKGVCKSMLELTFKVPGTVKEKGLVIKRLPHAELDAIIKGIQYPSAFSRRSRPLDVANYKAQEFRNLALFGFPAILRAIDHELAGQVGTIETRQLWCQFTFLLRAHILPEVCMTTKYIKFSNLIN